MTCDELIRNPEIDVVYIATPHQAHWELAVRAMECGKHVLVEKPAGANESQFREMLEAAKKNHVFFMEAVWTRFFPIMRKAVSLVRSGALGDIRTIESTFSFRVDDEDASRLIDPERAGGGLLDTGVYNLHLAQMIYNKAPVGIIGTASMDTDELHLQVDEQAAYIAQYDKGELAVMMSGIRTETLHTAFVYGTKGYLVIPVFWKPTEMKIVIGGKEEVLRIEVPQKIDGVEDEGYQYEIEYVNECLRQRRTESEEVSWEASLSVVRQMDELRRQWKLAYPPLNERRLNLYHFLRRI